MQRIALLLVALTLAGCGAAAPKPDVAPAPTAPAPQPAAQPAPVPAPNANPVNLNPAPGEVCNRPPDTSGIDIHIYPGESDRELAIKPGWTIPMGNNYFHVSLRFPAAVDRSSVRVSVDPAPWQVKYDPRNEPPGLQNSYTFSVLPGGQVGRGPEGKLTVTVSEARGTDGKPLISQPLRFAIWAFGPQDPGKPNPAALVQCPGLEVPPPPLPPGSK